MDSEREKQVQKFEVAYWPVLEGPLAGGYEVAVDRPGAPTAPGSGPGMTCFQALTLAEATERAGSAMLMMLTWEAGGKNAHVDGSPRTDLHRYQPGGTATSA